MSLVSSCSTCHRSNKAGRLWQGSNLKLLHYIRLRVCWGRICRPFHRLSWSPVRCGIVAMTWLVGGRFAQPQQLMLDKAENRWIYRLNHVAMRRLALSPIAWLFCDNFRSVTRKSGCFGDNKGYFRILRPTAMLLYPSTAGEIATTRCILRFCDSASD